MDTVQLAIADAAYAAALRELLERSGAGEVCAVEAPDPGRAGVIVVDAEAFARLPLPLAHPERVVLITRNDPEQLRRAWNAGIRSVVFCNDPLNTAVLAILAAGLRRSDPAKAAAGPCAGATGRERSVGAGQRPVERDGHQPKGRDKRG